MRQLLIKNLLEMLEDKELVLPAMQRPFVWEEDRIIRLMDSLMRKFPLGTILVWSTNRAQRYRSFRKNAHSEEHPVFIFERTPEGGRKMYVLDGQQRLTTLFIAFKGTLDDRRLYLDMLSGNPHGKDPGDTYYDFRFLSEPESIELNKLGPADGQPLRHFMPCEELLKVEIDEAAILADRIAKERGFAEQERQQIASTFTRATASLISDRALQVHVIDENSVTATPIEEILEIFVRVNSGGLVLNKADLLMSLLDLSWNDIQPAMMAITKEVNEHAPVQIDRDLVLKSALLFIEEESRFHLLVQERNRIEAIAPQLKPAMEPVRIGWKRLAVILADDCKIHSPRFFRGATNALLPFVVYLAHNPKYEHSERPRLVAGIYIALMSGVFGSAEARMGSFTRKHCGRVGKFPLEELAEMVSEKRRVFDLDDLLSMQLDLALNIAHGGITLDGNPDELERDHIFPRSALIREGVIQADHYANFHFLRQKDNRNKLDRPPHEWFRSPGGAPPYTDRELEERLLSWDLLEPGAFPKMLETRGQAIREKALRMFHMAAKEFDALF